MSERPWYRETFNQDYLEIYRPFLEERTARELEGLLTLAGPAPGSRILDLCCGHGRHAVELAARGFKVTGVDLSKSYLDEARELARGRGVRLRWLRKDMRELPYADEFELVVSLYNAFGYFDEDAENQRVLEGVARSLASGGSFFLDLLCADTMRADLGQLEMERKGYVLDERVEYDERGRRLLMHHHLRRRAGEGRYYLHSLRLYEPEEIREMLGRVGLVTCAQWGDFDGRGIGQGERLITLARKA